MLQAVSLNVAALWLTDDLSWVYPLSAKLQLGQARKIMDALLQNLLG